MIRRYVFAVIAACALLLSCENEHGPLNPEEEIVQFEPPPSFKEHWDKVAACIGFYYVNSRYEDITFYRAGEEVLFACRENEGGCYGLFVRKGVRIYFSGGKLDQEDWFVIEHEFAHAMLMDHNHSLPAWERCGLDKKTHWEMYYFPSASALRMAF